LSRSMRAGLPALALLMFGVAVAGAVRADTVVSAGRVAAPGVSSAPAFTLESSEPSALLPEYTPILAAGGLAAWLTSEGEDPERTARILDRSSIDLAIDAGDLFGSGYVVGGGSLALLLLGKTADQKRLSRTAADLCRSYLVSGAAVWALKVSIDRRRPDGGRYSFPSGHTAAAFSTVPVVARHYGRGAALPFALLAVFTGLGRMEDRRHYVSDVLFGAAIGLAAGEAVVGHTSAAGWLSRFSFAPRRVAFSYRF